MGTNSPSVRVLVRPPPAPARTTVAAPVSIPFLVPTDPAPTRQNGVVVVGFIGSRPDDVAHLINKIIDANIFGSGNLHRPFSFEEPEIVKWFEGRKLSYYHDDDKGILYLQFSTDCCLVNAFELPQIRFGSESVFEDQELGDLQGLLFMFSVCHVIILIQEGSRFDTRMLKKFRVLQAAKHAISLFLRSQNVPLITSKPLSSFSSWISSVASPNNPSPGKSRGRNGSTITPMSGLGSYTSLLPGQYTPVILFVFLDDFTEIHPSENAEESSETSINLSTSSNSSGRPGLPVKGSGPVVVLARPANKSEGGLKKKLQSSLEAQIRFSIKKCRTFSGSETSPAGLRSGAISSSAPLFSLDASKAVALVDASSCQSGESLEFAISLVEEVLDGKAISDSLLLENHQQNAKKEDIMSLKEFIYKQCDILRGRSGLVATNNSGSASDVGMVAVAAASAASGKMVITPELPSLEIWSSTCNLILCGILSVKQVSANRTEMNKTHEKNAVSPHREDITSPSPLKFVVSYLEKGIGMNSKFSTSWCEKAFPVAREVYLDNLSPCYPSSQHEDRLKKALLVLSSMVKGPAVQVYLNKLKDECTSIWSSGRQQCDAVSLTGNPCIHQVHNIKTSSGDDIKLHSSGFVYLHACACGRSRKLRPDPFDYETANVAYNVFADCDKLLPNVQLPKAIIKGPIQPSSWNLTRIGGVRYYDPSKGLLQSGFSPTHKFLSKWTVSEKPSEINQVLTEIDTKVNTVVDVDMESSHFVQLSGNGVESQTRPSSDITGTSSKNVSFNRGISNFTLRKPFSEVVAGPAAVNSGFPPLFSRKQSLPDIDQTVKLHRSFHQSVEKSGGGCTIEESQKVENNASIGKALMGNGIVDDKCKYDNPFLQIGSNIVPLNMNGSEQTRAANIMKHATIYVGFEHECPHGHRFTLTLDHLNELDSSYALPEENTVPLSVKKFDEKQDPAKVGKFVGHGRTRRQSNGITMVGGSGKTNSIEKPTEKVANGNMNSYNRSQVSDSVNDLDSDLKVTTSTSNDGDSPFNRSLPIYMNCPHCRDSMSKKSASNMKFANTISQLQRIFVVTPSFPILLVAEPIIQFEVSCLPPSVPDRTQKLQFSLGCPLVLPPESFLCLRLPFIYGVELDDGSLHSLKPFENQPELTAWILKGTSLQVVSQGSNVVLG